jgi:hypothetical protein
MKKSSRGGPTKKTVKAAAKPRTPLRVRANSTPPKPVAPARKVATQPSKPAPRVPVKPIKPAKPAPVLKPAPKPLSVNGNGNGKHALPAPTKPTAPAPKPLSAVFVKPAPRPEPVIPAEKDLSTKGKTGPVKDRVVMMVPDPYWLHVVWELSMQSVLRAEAALGQDWHGAKPILRLFDVTSTDTTSTSEAPIRDIPIHGGCTHWYVDVPQPPRTYRVDVGYLTRQGRFYPLSRSNVVTPPKAGASESVDENWAADIEKAGGADRVLAMSTGFETTTGPSQLKEFFDDQLKKPAKDGPFGAGAMPGKLKKFHFDIGAELIVFGRTDPAGTVTLNNEKVPLRPDGTFTMRYSLPDSRQIIPAVASSSDGLEEQTIVLAIERNIKRLDPMTHDLYGEV